LDGVSKIAARRKPTEKGAQACSQKNLYDQWLCDDFHFQARFSFLLEQVWLDTEEGTA